MAIPVKGYEDYLIYEDGRIWSNKTNKFLKASTTQSGYKYVQLFNEDGHKNKFVHRLVAQAFIPNPNELPQVNHKDENPANNNTSNLEWCDAKYNMNYGNGKFKRRQNIDYSKPIFKENAIKNGKTVSIPVCMILDGEIIGRFESAKEASVKTGVSQSCILRVVHGERKSAGGYFWKRMEVAS